MDEFDRIVTVASAAGRPRGTSQVESGTVVAVDNRTLLVDGDASGQVWAQAVTGTTPTAGERVALLRDTVSGAMTVIGFVREARRVSAFTSLAAGTVITNELLRAGPVVHATLAVDGVAFTAGMSLGTIPVGFRPVRRLSPVCGIDSNTGTVNTFRVDPSGGVLWQGRSATTDRVRLTVTWVPA
ncbi:MAG: hypothetical protein AAGA90_24175 [Actinomycetota bacterium]